MVLSHPQMYSESVLTNLNVHFQHFLVSLKSRSSPMLLFNSEIREGKRSPSLPILFVAQLGI